ncbi:hypothetical protein FRB93_010614 [Tulasnella sp. JGI-2019a]|nr:hypothetical protein FRB93_010614 [Tulasnella sp. JGI-2019a]
MFDLDHQIVSFSPIESLDMDESGVITSRGILVAPTAFQLMTQAMVDAMEYVDTGLKSETTKVTVDAEQHTLERLCFPRQVIEDMLPDTGERTLLQASLERSLRTGSVGPFYRGLTVDIAPEEVQSDEHPPAAGDARSSDSSLRLLRSALRNKHLVAYELRALDIQYEEDNEGEVEDEGEVEMEINVEVEDEDEDEEAVMPAVTEDEGSVTGAMEFDESEARRERRLGKKRARDDELEGESEDAASGSGLIRSPRQTTAGESIRRRAVRLGLDKHLPIAHIDSARQSSPSADSNDEVEGTHLAKKRRVDESSQIAIQDDEGDDDVEVDATPHASSSKGRYPAMASTRLQAASPSTAPIASGIVAPAAPPPPPADVADPSVRVRRPVSRSYAERQAAWQPPAPVGKVAPTPKARRSKEKVISSGGKGRVVPPRRSPRK